MKNNLTTTNQNAKLALSKSKNLLNITKNLLENRDTNNIFIIQKFFINKLILDDSEIKDKYFISNADGKTIKIFDLSTGLLMKELEDSVNNLAFFKISKNKDLMITYNFDEKAQLWNLNTGKLYKEFLLNFTTITFSDSEELIAYGEDNLIDQINYFVPKDQGLQFYLYLDYYVGKCTDDVCKNKEYTYTFYEDEDVFVITQKINY